jgi:hypothetical protein
LYLRQPGYGAGYVTGKYLVDRIIMDLSRQAGSGFRVYDFFNSMYSSGMIPVSLIRWEMTGNADEITAINGGK